MAVSRALEEGLATPPKKCGRGASVVGGGTKAGQDGAGSEG